MAESGQTTINILDVLSEHQDFHSSIFLTYGADLAFFENAILPTLWDKGCRHNLIFMDAERYNDTLRDFRGGVSQVGHRYLVVAIRLGRFQSFHPKQILLLGAERARQLVGSGNLTFTGLGRNHEVFTCIDWTPEQSEWQYLYVQAWQVIRTIMQKWGHSREARNILQRVEQLSPWLLHTPETTTEVQLLHSLNQSLLEQIAQALNGAIVQKITVISPFLDNRATVLNALYERFRPTTLQLVLQDHRTVGNPEALQDLLKSGDWLKIHRFRQIDEAERYLHAKIYLFETADAVYAITGSANCSQAALLSTSTEGNVEVVLLRKANSHRHFADLLRNRLSPSPITNLEKISLKPTDIQPPKNEGQVVQLLDLSVENGMISASYVVNSLSETIVALQLKISTIPPCFVPLAIPSAGSHYTEVIISDELQKLFSRPQSASIWGLDNVGQSIDLHCNELWITHVDILRHGISRVTTVDIGAGDRLADGIIESESEWHQLYETLTKLIELDVVQLKSKKKGGYFSQKSEKKIGSEQNSREKEILVLLVDTYDEDKMAALRETEETFFKESDFTRWFEYIRARLPGAQGEDAAVDRGSSGDDPDDIDDSDEQAGAPGIESNGKKRTGHKWTPSQGEGRRFINLVSKYITSLNNDEYMQIASIHHKATYYTVFQRITWLLLEHGVIDTARFIDLVCQINAGFFGLPSDDPPILCPRLRTHLRSVWYQEWEAYDMSAHVLASLYIVNLLVSGIDDEALPAQLEQQAAWVLAGLTSIVGPPKFTQSNDAYSRLAEWYHEDEIDLILQTEQNYNTRLANINQILNRWSQRVTIALENTKDELLRKLLLQARVDYGRARYYALDLLQNLQEQTNLCSNLILWTRFAGDEEGSKQYRERLILLLQAQGFSHGAAEKLFEQGVNLFLSSEHKEAATKLHQALILAEQTNDAVLLKKCNQYLGYTKFFLK